MRVGLRARRAGCPLDRPAVAEAAAVGEDILVDVIIGRCAGDPVSKLRAAGRAYVEFGLSHPNHYRATFNAEEPSKPEAEADIRVSAGERCFKFLQTMLAECVTSRSFREADLDATSQALWAVMHGLTSLLIVRPDFAWCGRDNLVDGLLDTVSEGLRA